MDKTVNFENVNQIEKNHQHNQEYVRIDEAIEQHSLVQDNNKLLEKPEEAAEQNMMEANDKMLANMLKDKLGQLPMNENGAEEQKNYFEVPKRVNTRLIKNIKDDKLEELKKLCKKDGEILEEIQHIKEQANEAEGMVAIDALCVAGTAEIENLIANRDAIARIMGYEETEYKSADIILELKLHQYLYIILNEKIPQDADIPNSITQLKSKINLIKEQKEALENERYLIELDVIEDEAICNNYKELKSLTKPKNAAALKKSVAQGISFFDNAMKYRLEKEAGNNGDGDGFEHRTVSRISQMSINVKCQTEKIRWLKKLAKSISADATLEEEHKTLENQIGSLVKELKETEYRLEGKKLELDTYKMYMENSQKKELFVEKWGGELSVDEMNYINRNNELIDGCINTSLTLMQDKELGSKEIQKGGGKAVFDNELAQSARNKDAYSDDEKSIDERLGEVARAMANLNLNTFAQIKEFVKGKGNGTDDFINNICCAFGKRINQLSSSKEDKEKAAVYEKTMKFAYAVGEVYRMYARFNIERFTLDNFAVMYSLLNTYFGTKEGSLSIDMEHFDEKSYHIGDLAREYLKEPVDIIEYRKYKIEGEFDTQYITESSVFMSFKKDKKKGAAKAAQKEEPKAEVKLENNAEEKVEEKVEEKAEEKIEEEKIEEKVEEKVEEKIEEKAEAEKIDNKVDS